MTRLAKFFLLVLILICFYFLYRMFEPYLPVILITIVLASVSYPIYKVFLKLFKYKEGPASLVTCLLVIILIVGPLFLIGIIVINKVLDSYMIIQEEMSKGSFDQIIEFGNLKSLLNLIKEYAPFIEIDELSIKNNILGYLQDLGSSIVTFGTQLVSDIGMLVVKFFLMIFTLFFLYKDGKKLLNVLVQLSPLSSKNEQTILDKFADVSKSVVMGIFLTALLQGIIGGIGIWITPLNGTTFWGLFLGICSVIPLVGNALIWIPISIYLLSIGETGYGIFLLIYCGAAFVLIENLVKPYLIKGKSEMHPLIVFFSLLGGIYFFGMGGIIFGPLIAGLTQALLEIYELEFQTELYSDHFPIFETKEIKNQKKARKNRIHLHLKSRKKDKSLRPYLQDNDIEEHPGKDKESPSQNFDELV